MPLFFLYFLQNIFAGSRILDWQFLSNIVHCLLASWIISGEKSTVSLIAASLKAIYVFFSLLLFSRFILMCLGVFFFLPIFVCLLFIYVYRVSWICGLISFTVLKAIIHSHQIFNLKNFLSSIHLVDHMHIIYVSYILFLSFCLSALVYAGYFIWTYLRVIIQSSLVY